VLLQPEATLLRQGEGTSVFPTRPSRLRHDATLFAGVVERTGTARPGAAWQHGAWGLSGNGGVHLDHTRQLTGASDTKWWEAHAGLPVPRPGSAPLSGSQPEPRLTRDHLEQLFTQMRRGV